MWQQEAAERLFTQDGIEVFRIYEDGTEGAVTSLNDLQEHAEKDGLFGVEKETWEALHEYNAMKQQLRESEPTKEALLLYGKEDSYGIYAHRGKRKAAVRRSNLFPGQMLVGGKLRLLLL